LIKEDPVQNKNKKRENELEAVSDVIRDLRAFLNLLSFLFMHRVF
jgi:hypothetical protein